MIKTRFSLYIALIVIVSFSIAFRTFLQIHFDYEHALINNTGSSGLMAAKLESALDDARCEEIATQVRSMEGVATTRLERLVPPWQGPAEYETQWKTLWKTYMSPILYISLSSLSKTIDPPSYAAQIKSVSGVINVVWDNEGNQNREEQNLKLDRKQFFFSVFYFFFIGSSLLGLLASYPMRFKRHYVVRTGMGGAGSHINPENVWMVLILYHIISAMIVYAIVFTLGYSLFPFDVSLDLGRGVLSYLMEGLFLSGMLTAAVCLVGWWFKAEELDAVAIMHPPISD